MNNCNLSIIVPVYNVESYLDECIQSIINQSYREFELILVNDGSTDGSKLICEKYVNLDKRIKLINKENGGLSDARNIGIENAVGEFLLLVDSDDILMENALEVMMKSAQVSKADIVIGNHMFIYDNKKNELYDKEKLNKEYTVDEALKEILYQKRFTNSAWAKLYKRNLFNDINYPVGKLFEDLATTHKLFIKSKIIYYTCTPVYGYRQRENSIMSSNFSEKKLDIIKIAEDMVKEINLYSNKLYIPATSRLISAYMQLYLELPINGYNDTKRYLVSQVKKYGKLIVFDKNVRLKNKVAVILVWLGNGKLLKKVARR